MGRFWSIVAGCVLLLLFLAGCGGGDRPPDGAEPPPPALEGVFTCAYGSLRFNGDGRSIELELTEEFAALSGLPEGKSEGTYVFLFRNEEWRYDKAESFRLNVNGASTQFSNALGQTNEKAVAFYLEDGSTARFEKEE